MFANKTAKLSDTPVKTRKPYLASMIGTALEYYDISLYSFMAPILAPIFLPNMERVNALILAFLVISLGILSRPLGAFLLGKMGDRLGRKKALVVSITGTAVVTGLIGCLPTYASIGIAAPLLLGLLGVMQKFFVAGEYNGGAIFMLEHSKQGKGFRSGLYCGCTVVGILAAAFMAALVAHLPEGYWRIAYLLGFLTALFGIYIRKKTPESPEFEARKVDHQRNFKENLRHYKQQILWSVGAAGFFSALFYIPSVFMNAFVPLVSSISTEEILVINTWTLAVYMLFLPISGALADKISFKKSMLWASLASILLSYPLLLLLNTNSIICITIMKMSFALLAAWFIGPFHAWIQDLYAVKNRYQMISLTYSLGAQIGAFTPPLTLFFWKHTGITQIPAVFIATWGIIGALSILKAKNSSSMIRPLE